MGGDRLTRHRTASPALTALVAGLAVLATTATSPETEPSGVVLFSFEGAMYAYLDDGFLPDPEEWETEAPWSSSEDGGRTWREVPAPERNRVTDATDRLRRDTEVTACTTIGTCYRVRQDEIQERPTGEPWTTSFRYSGEQVRRMDLKARGGPADLPVGPPVVDGTDVVVGSGSQGILRRSGTGPWQRQALMGAEPLSLAGPSWLSHLVWTPVLLFVAGIALSGLAAARYRTSRIVVAVLICWTAAAVLLLNAGWQGEVDYQTRGPWIAILSVLALLVSMASLHGGDLPDRHEG